MKKAPSIRRPILTVLLAVSLTACQSLSPGATSTDLDRLQGYWEGRGPGGECSVTISGNSLRFYAREDFWYETTFTLPEATGPKQLHATIVENSTPEQLHIGTVVVTIFEMDGEKLTLGVVEDYVELPTEPIVGDWDWVMDIYYLERARDAAGT